MKIWYQFIAAVSLFVVISCNSKGDKKDEIQTKVKAEIPELKLHIDSLKITDFYTEYPKLAKFQDEVLALYKKNKSTQLWQDNKGVDEFAHTLFNKYKGLEEEGLKANFPYKELNSVFENNSENKLSKENTDLMISNLYFYYAEKVYSGVDEKTSISLEWLLPRKKLNYQALTDSIFKKSTINDDHRKQNV